MKLLRWLLVVVALAAVVVVLRLTVLAEKPVEVRVATVGSGEVGEIVTNTRAGTVKVRTRAKLSPQQGGLVVELPHREGEAVEAGTLLLRLDDRAQRAQLELAQRSVVAARARADEACMAAALAEKELDRALALHRRGIASDQSLDLLESESDRARAGCDAGTAAVAEAEAQVEVARVQVDLCEVRAPFAGTVADVGTEVGEWITPSPPGVPIPPVIDLLDADSVYVSAPIDEIDAERVAVGQDVRLTVDSRPGASFAGRVARVAPYVLDQLEQNRTVEVEVDFVDSQNASGMLPGTSADVEVILSRHEDVLRVPTSAVAAGGVVLVVVDGVLEERQLTAGLTNWQFTEVVAGLAEGEQVVVARDSTRIRAGAPATVREE
jgi:HlyD family secretion protein